MQVAVERVGDAEEGVDPRGPAAALQPSDRRLCRADEVGEIGLREPALPAPFSDLTGDLGEEPALLGPREPGAQSFEGLTHISIMLYIAIMRYGRSLAAGVAYALLYGAFVLSAGSLDGEPLAAAAYVALALLQVVAGFALGWRAYLLLPLLPLLAIPVPVPEDAYEPFPLWFVMLYLGLPIAAVLMTPGVVLRALAR